jgi:UDP-N-acetylmuramate: L-alanyl-gamma-D-glutamyl-meso-diaminopimelate ligase|tara:strand:+ start:4741 stop:6099 length:1359 start_codon:yes stop_codon:yes gene_type:complete
MHFHFIAIGGSAMHNLAIALYLKGEQVSGSDDEIFSPSKERLKKHGLLPDKIGWNPELINEQVDTIILGMHARIDNPELLKAKELQIPVFSYPEFIYEQTKNQLRVVIGGSHGKTSITSMILHVLNKNNIDHNYMVGAQLEGFDCMVKLSDTSKIAIIEGDEYLSSPIDRRPKFHLYRPNIAVISGIAWDHINVFPTFENYIKQFHIFAESIDKEGTLIFCKEDKNLNNMVNSNSYSCQLIPYNTHNHLIEKSNTILIDKDNIRYPIEIFGIHNLQNLKAAQLVCEKIGVDKTDFYNSIADFKGASKRMELVMANNYSAFYKDFAHSPSKLKATTNALKHQFPNRTLIACMELHTFSSLNSEFLKLYFKSMVAADVAYVYYNIETIKHKKLENIDEKDVYNAFGTSNLKVFTSSKDLQDQLFSQNWDNSNLLMMSSGNFDGLDFDNIAKNIF